MRVNFAEPNKQVYDSRTFKSAIQRITTDKSLQIVVILLPRNMRKDYAAIKLITTTTAVVPTQVVMLPINEKRFMSIIEKVALQIQAKVGAQLWTVRPSTAFGRFLMVVGIDVFHDTVNKRNSILGFCATIHPNLSKYYSTIAVHSTGQEIGTVIGNLFTEAINVFSEKAKRYPETVIFFRDGVSESQVEAVRRMEVESVLNACQRVRVGSEAYNPDIIYTVVVKNTSTRLFAPAGSTRGGGRGGRGGRGARGGAATAPGEVSNPPPGTLVVDQIVPEKGDFFLISHYANQGMAAPSLYRTVYTSHPDNFPLEELARLAYKLCHMYYNWSGAIKVPAPCMMAHKLAFLVGQCVHGAVDPRIRLSQFYL
jgi:aubergine-like protein